MAWKLINPAAAVFIRSNERAVLAASARMPPSVLLAVAAAYVMPVRNAALFRRSVVSSVATVVILIFLFVV